MTTAFILAAIVIWFLVAKLCKESDRKATREFFKGDL